MKVFERIERQARRDPQHIVLMEGEDDRVLQAAGQAVEGGIARVTVLGHEPTVRQRMACLGLSGAGFRIMDPGTEEQVGRFAARLHELRQHKGVTRATAHELAGTPLYAAMLMVAAGEADGCVGGAVHATADVVRAALQVVGVAEDAALVSSFFLMLLCEPHHDHQGGLIFADCGLNVDPNPTELAEIALSSADTARTLLGEDPRVAMLSFSTYGSATHPHVEKVVEAIRVMQGRNPEIAVEREVQFDAAIVPEVGNRKAPGAISAGAANVLIFPDLDAGNIGYKIAERVGKAHAIGPILQGLVRPVNDLSRGCSVEDVYRACVITVVQAQTTP